MFAEIDKYLDEYDGENAYRIAKQVFLPFDVQLIKGPLKSMKFVIMDFALSSLPLSGPTYSIDKLIVKTEAEYAGLCHRLAHACYILSNYCQTNEERRKTLLIEAHDACKKAYKIEPKDADVLKWCSIITGSLAEISGNREKIELGHEFKMYLDKAAEVAPDSAIYHMRGRFFYEVANLSWLERTAATALFGTPPTATIDESLADLLKAEELNPGELDNLLFIAKCYLAKGEHSKARTYLLRMKATTAIDRADEAMLDEANNLLKSIASTESDSEKQSTQKISERKVEPALSEGDKKEERLSNREIDETDQYPLVMSEFI
uniref:Regulator of microtubule dynamics protein 1 n=1 Tax=Ascaris lumbricoides TaxID=6252 RepID=A0A9J2PAA0_ASCLU